MRRFLGTAALVIVAFIAIVLLIASFKPGEYSVSRSVVVNAPPEKIAPLIQDFHNFASWSPWQHLDPNMTIAYSGAESGPGAMYTWEGNSKAGKGSMIELSASKFQTKITVNFMKPYEAQALSTYDLTPQPGGSTRVTWTMAGKQSFMAKIMSVFVSMDKMIGPDFEQGLANLKKLAEH